MSILGRLRWEADVLSDLQAQMQIPFLMAPNFGRVRHGLLELGEPDSRGIPSARRRRVRPRRSRSPFLRQNAGSLARWTAAETQIAAAGGYGTSWPQWEQRLALSGMGERHSGQSLVAGSSTGPGSSLRFKVFIPLTTAKIQAATITKSKMVLMNWP